MWAIGALAEGLGIRAVARVFEVDPNTVLHWLVEVADHAAAFSQYFLHDVRVTQVQLDELFALRSAVRIACPATIQLKGRECVMHGWSAEQISAVQDGVIHPDFTASERLLLRYADDVTRTPIDVDLQVFRELRRHFTPEQIAEATASICYENFRTRYSNAMGTDLGQHEKPSVNVSMEVSLCIGKLMPGKGGNRRYGIRHESCPRT